MLTRIQVDHLAASAASLYLLGFVIVNTHYGTYHIVDYDLFRAQYIAAALVFLFVTVIPAGAGAALPFLWQNMQHEQTARVHRMVVPIVVSVLVGFVGLLTFFQFLEHVALLPMHRSEMRRVYSWQTAAYFGITFLSTGVISSTSLRLDRTLARSSEARTLEIPFVFMLAGALPLAVVVQFALSVYPLIRPGFGGGAVWIATTTPRSALVSAGALGTPAPEVIVLNRDANFMRLLVCYITPNSPGNLRALEIPRAKVDVLDVGTAGTIEEFMNRCSKLRLRLAHPAAVAPQHDRTPRGGGKTARPNP